MNKSYVAHKEYVRGIVREIYPAANLDEDFQDVASLYCSGTVKR